MFQASLSSTGFQQWPNSSFGLIADGHKEQATPTKDSELKLSEEAVTKSGLEFYVLRRLLVVSSCFTKKMTHKQCEENLK